MINIRFGVYGSKKYWLIKDFYGNVHKDTISLVYGKEYTLSVELKEANSKRENESSWTLILGCQEKQELLAVKKVKSKRSESFLTFITPLEQGMDMILLSLCKCYENYKFNFNL